MIADIEGVMAERPSRDTHPSARRKGPQSQEAGGPVRGTPDQAAEKMRGKAEDQAEKEQDDTPHAAQLCFHGRQFVPVPVIRLSYDR